MTCRDERRSSGDEHDLQDGKQVSKEHRKAHCGRRHTLQMSEPVKAMVGMCGYEGGYGLSSAGAGFYSALRTLRK